MDRSECIELVAQWFAKDECRSIASEEDHQAATSLLRFLNHTNGVYLWRKMPPGFYEAEMRSLAADCGVMTHPWKRVVSPTPGRAEGVTYGPGDTTEVGEIDRD
jgi:hypothetical protein